MIKEYGFVLQKTAILSRFVLSLFILGLLFPGRSIAQAGGQEGQPAQSSLEEARDMLERASQSQFERRVNLLEQYTESIKEKVQERVGQGMDEQEAIRQTSGHGRQERVGRAKAFLREQMHKGSLDPDKIASRFANHQTILEEFFARDEVYLAIPFQESRYSEEAFTKARVQGREETVKGLWQFIESTGREYGLEVTSAGREQQATDTDERYDVRKSTRAARAFLTDLEEELNVEGDPDVSLVLCAYHLGLGATNRLIDRNGSSDFWQWEQAADLGFGPKSYHYPALVLAAHELLRERGIL